MTEVDTFNKTAVGIQGDNIVFLHLPPFSNLSKEEALVHAAWIVVLADDGRGRWEEVLKAVRST